MNDPETINPAQPHLKDGAVEGGLKFVVRWFILYALASGFVILILLFL